MSDLVRIQIVGFLTPELTHMAVIIPVMALCMAPGFPLYSHFIYFPFHLLPILSTPIWAATWENRIFAYAKTKTQISFAVTAKLISAFVFATWIVQSLCFLNPKFQVSSHLLWLYSPVCVGPGRKPRRPVFWRRGSFCLLPLSLLPFRLLFLFFKKWVKYISKHYFLWMTSD